MRCRGVFAAIDQSRSSLGCLLLLLREIGVACGLLQPGFLFVGCDLGRGEFLPCTGVPSPGASAVAVGLEPSGWDAIEVKLICAVALATFAFRVALMDFVIGYDTAQRNL